MSSDNDDLMPTGMGEPNNDVSPTFKGNANEQKQDQDAVNYTQDNRTMVEKENIEPALTPDGTEEKDSSHRQNYNERLANEQQKSGEENQAIKQDFENTKAQPTLDEFHEIDRQSGNLAEQSQDVDDKEQDAFSKVDKEKEWSDRLQLDKGKGRSQQ